jgi:hypothetical protein
VVPMRALIDTGTTSTIILREFVGKDRSRTNTKKRTKWKTLGGTFTTNYESLLDFKFPEIGTIKVLTWQAHVDDNASSKSPLARDSREIGWLRGPVKVPTERPR